MARHRRGVRTGSRSTPWAARQPHVQPIAQSRKGKVCEASQISDEDGKKKKKGGTDRSPCMILLASKC